MENFLVGFGVLGAIISIIFFSILLSFLGVTIYKGIFRMDNKLIPTNKELVLGFFVSILFFGGIFYIIWLVGYFVNIWLG